MRYFAKDIVRDCEIQERSAALTAWALSRDTRLHADPVEAFVHRGYGKFTPMTKAAVAAMDTSDAAVALGPLTGALVEQVDRLSLVSRLEAAGALRVPVAPAQSARVVVGEVEAAEAAEGAAKRVSRLDFSANAAPKKAATIVVFSAEFARSFSPAHQASIARAVERAAALETDRVLLGLLTAGSASSSTTIAELIGELSDGEPQAPVVLASYSILLGSAALVRDLQALNIAVIPSSVTGGAIVAVDAAAVLLGASDVRVEPSREAMLSLDDAGAGTPTFSLWQRNCTAILAERFVQLAMRADAVGYIAGSPA